MHPCIKGSIRSRIIAQGGVSAVFLVARLATQKVYEVSTTLAPPPLQE